MRLIFVESVYLELEVFLDLDKKLGKNKKGRQKLESEVGKKLKSSPDFDLFESGSWVD